ncbi:MAG: hypothetical protein ACLFOY_00775 [Desulfatibacillaceae bacterium]
MFSRRLSALVRRGSVRKVLKVVLLVAVVVCLVPPLCGNAFVGDTVEIVTGDVAAHDLGHSPKTGGFLAVWTDRPAEGPASVVVRLFDQTGHPGGAQLLAETVAGGASVSVDAAESGNWVVVWSSDDRVHAATLDPEGVVLVRATIGESASGARPVLSGGADGRYLVAWEQGNLFGTTNVVGCWYSEQTAEISDTFKIAGSMAGARYNPSVDCLDGSFFVAWETEARIRGTTGIQGVRIPAGASGNKDFGAQVTFSEAGARNPTVAAGGQGLFCVAWEGARADGPDVLEYAFTRAGKVENTGSLGVRGSRVVEPALAWTGAKDRFLLAYAVEGNAAGTNVAASVVDLEERENTDELVAGTPVDEHDPRVACAGTARIGVLVSWRAGGLYAAPWSVCAEVKAPVGLDAPAHSPDGTFLVTWDAVTNAVGYEVERTRGPDFDEVDTIPAETLSLLESDLERGIYRYRVRAVNTCAQKSVWSDVVKVAVCRAPAAPEEIASPALDGDGTFRIVWESVPGAVEYELQRASSAEFADAVTLATTESTAYTVEGAASGDHFHRVRAASDCGLSGPWVADDGVTVCQKPGTPENVSAFRRGMESFVVEWSEVPGATRYVVLRSDSRELTGATEVCAVSETACLARDLGPGAHHFAVMAINACGESLTPVFAESAVHSCTDPAVPRFLSAPEKSRDGSIALAWAPVSGGEEYLLQHSRDPGFSRERTVQVGPARDATLRGMPSGVHYFRVAARNRCGATSGWRVAGPVSVTLPALLWEEEPRAAGPDKITMTAMSPDFPGAGVRYRFICTGSPTGGQGATTTSWRPSREFTDAYLSPNSLYTYKAEAMSGGGAATAPTPERGAYTAIETPERLVFGGVGQDSVMVRCATQLTGLDRGDSGLRIMCPTTGEDSGWMRENGTWELDGLEPGRTYEFTVQARNGDGVVTPVSEAFRISTKSAP